MAHSNGLDDARDKATARFVAAARDLVPALAAERDALAARVAELEAENKRLRDALSAFLHEVERRANDLGGYDGRFPLRKEINNARAALGDA